MFVSLLSVILLTGQLWMSFPASGDEILHGSWQSCRDADGVYSERIYDHHEHGRWVWSFHMGPLHEFALYRAKDDPEDSDSIHMHSGPTNLLGPRYVVENDEYRGKRTWTVPSLHLWVNVIQAGGSREDCESYVVLIRRTR